MPHVPLSMQIENEAQLTQAVWAFCRAYGYSDEGEPLPAFADLNHEDITPEMTEFMLDRIGIYINDVVSGELGKEGEAAKNSFVAANKLAIQLRGAEE